MALSGWDPGKKIRLVIPPQSEVLTDFPVLVNLTSASGVTGFDCQYVFSELGASSLKCAVEYGETGQQCYVEIERWDDAGSSAQLWVKVPEISSTSDTVLYFYYDALQADNTAYVGNTGETPAQQVWDANFIAVYHMSQDPSAGGACILDSTANANHGTPYGSMTSANLVDGLIGKALYFDGVDDEIDLGFAADLSSMTLEASVSTPGIPAGKKGFILNNSSYYADSYTNFPVSLALRDDEFASYTLSIGDDYTADVSLLSASAVALNTFVFLAATNDPGGLSTLRVNNELQDSSSGVTPSSTTLTWKVGRASYRYGGGVDNDQFTGTIDEVRISSIVRSAGWLDTTSLSITDTLIIFSGQTVVRASLGQPYDLEAVYATAAIEQTYSLAFQVTQQLEQVYGLRLAALLSQYYGNAPVILQKLIQHYGDAAVLRRALQQLYSDALILRASLDQPYTYPEALQSILAQRYGISGNRLLQMLEEQWAIRGVDLARAALTQPFAITDGTGHMLDYTVTVSVAGTELQFHHVNIEASRDQYCLSCEIHLSSQVDYVQCRVLDDLVVIINGQEFRFFVESKQRRRGHATAEYTIHGLSRTALLDAPYADPVTGALTGMASQIVADLAGGHTVDWQTVDWHIPDDTLMPADQTPLAIIRQVAAAAGAILQTRPDGTLVIEPAYPVRVPDWQTTAPDHHLTDAFDFFTTGENFDHRPGYNRVLISDQLTAEDMLRIEEEPTGDFQKIIRVYQAPWRDDFVLRHTGGDWVGVEPLGIEERLVEDEVVEFVGGSGHTAYPVYSRQSMTWMQADLGSVVFGEDGALVADVDGESLLQISYMTKCRKYLVTTDRIEQVQFVAEVVE